MDTRLNIEHCLVTAKGHSQLNLCSLHQYWPATVEYQLVWILANVYTHFPTFNLNAIPVKSGYIHAVFFYKVISQICH